jgi:hypothetical protein
MIVFVLSSWTGMTISNRISAQKEINDKYISTYKYIHGFTSDYKGHGLAYCLFTNNGGRNWYVIRENFLKDEQGNITGSTRDDRMIILGPVETVYPGLLTHINDLEDLTKELRK